MLILHELRPLPEHQQQTYHLDFQLDCQAAAGLWWTGLEV